MEMEGKKFVAVIWDEEDLYSVGSSKALLGSNLESFKPGDATMANFGRRKFHAYVLKFSNDEKQLKQEVATLYSEFKKANFLKDTVEQGQREGDNTLENNITVEMEDTEDDMPVLVPPKKRSKNIDDQSTKVRKELIFERKQKEAARQEANREATVNLLVSQRCKDLEEKVAGLEGTIASLAATNASLVAAINGLREDMGGVLQRVSCRHCMKLHIRSSTSRTPEMRMSSPTQVSSLQVSTSLTRQMLPSPSPQMLPPLSPQMLPPPTPTTELPVSSPNESIVDVFSSNGSEQNLGGHGGCEDIQNDSSDELSYLGEAQYGVRLRTEDLRRCESSSNSGEKLALSLLEFLVTQEECRDMSVYGQAKHKREMDPKKRKALRSHVFARFFLEKSKEEKDTIWMDKIVYKLNDKIRGIKNGKYKSLSTI